LLLAFPAALAAQSVEQQLGEEVMRLRKLGAAQPDGDLWKDLKPRIEAGLDRIEKDLAAGHTLVALRGMANIRVHLLAVAYANDRAAARKDLTAFEQEWRRVDGELRPLERRQREAAWGPAPAAARALAEASLGTALPLYEASREYAAVTTPLDGLFYMGQARGALDYAQLLRKLRFAESYGQFAPRSLAAEIDQFEQQVEKAYQPPLSIERHRDFIQLNAWVKRAVELDQRKLYYGALYAYLEAVRSLAELLAGAPSVGQLAELQVSATRFEPRLGERGRDDSIGRMFLELAQREIERAQAGEAASAVSARAIVEKVLPAYFAVVERNGNESTVAAKTELTVTLVRWPFT